MTVSITLSPNTLPAQATGTSVFLQQSMVALRGQLAAMALTPSDLAEACIAQVARYESQVQAWVTFSPELLRQQAKTVDRAVANAIVAGRPVRPLEGMPIGIKDIMNTHDFPTEMGSPLWDGFLPGNDARVVYYCKDEGALIPGKTVTAEFAVHTLGKTLNPFDATRTPGTSSSGSAVAVAMGMVPAALGTQTAGSIVRPASFCGVFGVKPSFGLLPRTGMLKTTDSLDTVGYFTAHLEDIPLLFDILRVKGQNFPISHAALSDTTRQCKPAGQPWRLGIVRPSHVWGHATEDAKSQFDAWVAQLAALPNVIVETVDLPEIAQQSHTLHATIYNKTLAYYFQAEFEKAELVSPIMNRLITEGQAITPDQYKAALGQQEQLAQAVDTVLSPYDACFTLSTAGPAPLREVEESPDSALLWTMSYVPVVSVPQFVSQAPETAGLPFGLQVVARRYNDYRLFSVLAMLAEQGTIATRCHPTPAMLG